MPNTSTDTNGGSNGNIVPKHEMEARLCHIIEFIEIYIDDKGEFQYRTLYGTTVSLDGRLVQTPCINKTEYAAEQAAEYIINGYQLTGKIWALVI